MRKMKVRNSKHKNIFYKISTIIIIASFSFCLTLRYFVRNIDNESFIKLLLKNGNRHIEVSDNSKYFSKLLKVISNVDFKKPTTLLNINYVEKENNIKKEETTFNENYISDPYDNESKEPIVYLYNTHQKEEYSTNNLEIYNITPTVMMTSYILREKLNDNGIPTIVEENNVTEFLNTNNWSYSSSYKVTKLLMEDAYSKNNSLKYFIDLHRDSVKKSISTTNINGISYAKILFIVGLENKNYVENLKVTETLNNKFNEKYPGLSRGIYKKQGSGVNGVYNQDFSSNTILIEVGGYENTIDEVYNTCEAIATILTEYIKEQEDEK